ncbi:hypothetical protein [Enterococcus devriesei]|uniref:hypothetical protein n=1 Tax=Enterococcus devriesei TaxID=319970 RepID=UPI0028A7EFD2|nr:hypothetical protein [Enterococcus devriesei]
MVKSLQLGYICDTNIWVKVVLGNVRTSFFTTFKDISFADAVENEIIKWERNTDKYNKIASNFVDSKNKSFEVIYLEDLDIITQKAVKKQLKQFGFTNLDNSSATIKNLGEYLSVVYAYYLDIPFLQTEDIEFYEEIDLQSTFKGIEIVTWNEIAQKITKDDKERIRLNKIIESEQKIMSARKKESDNLNAKLRAFQNKFNSR